MILSSPKDSTLSQMALFDRPQYHFRWAVRSNSVDMEHSYVMAACDLHKSCSFDNTVENAGHVRFPMRM